MDQILFWSDLSSLNRLIPVESLKLGPVDLTKAFDNLISASSSARRPFRLILLTKFQMIPRFKCTRRILSRNQWTSQPYFFLSKVSDSLPWISGITKRFLILYVEWKEYHFWKLILKMVPLIQKNTLPEFKMNEFQKLNFPIMPVFNGLILTKWSPVLNRVKNSLICLFPWPMLFWSPYFHFYIKIIIKYE